MEVKRIHISAVTCPKRHRVDLGDLAKLAASIKDNQQLQPIIVSQAKGGYRLLAGERRFRAMRDVLGESMIEAKVIDLKDEMHALIVEREENEKKTYTVEEMVSLGKAIEAALGNRTGRPSEKIPQNFGELKGKETAEIAAEGAGFGNPETYRQAKKVVDNGTPELRAAVNDGTLSVSDAAAVASTPAPAQRAAVGKVRNGTARTAKEAAGIGDAYEGEVEHFKDALGQDVPEHIGPAFAAAKEIESVCREIDGVIRKVDAIAKGPGGRLLRLESLRQMLRDAKGNLWANRPTHICPYCDGKTTKKVCEACKGDGWTAKHVYDASPVGSKARK